MSIKKIISGLLLTVASAVASAAPWTQTIDFAPDIFLTGPLLAGPDSHTWTHNLTGSGFDPGFDTINNFSLVVNIKDDVDTGLLRLETGFLDVHQASDRILLSPIGSTTFNSTLVDLFAIVQLNTNGTLGVTLTATSGDFFLDSATLTAQGVDGTPVPEPGSIALAGIALLGLGLTARSRKRRAA